MIKDPAFWSTVIAVVALVLSQLPPVRELLKARQLRILIPDNLTLQHYMGNLQLVVFLALRNSGGREVMVQKVECVITSEEGRHWRLPAQTIVTSPAGGHSSPELFMGWVSLKPDEQWTQTVRFFKVWSVQDEEEATGISARIRTDINTKISQRLPEQSNKLAEADPELVQQAKDFFEKRFSLTKGSYRLLVAASSDGNELLCVRGFDFTLFDHQVRALRSAVDDYKIGAGIYYMNNDPSKGGAFIRLRPLAETEVQAEYARMLAA